MSNSARIQNKTLSTRIATAPTTIQNLRAKIIKNAIQFAQQLSDYQFNKLSEIIRVCTALGAERAFLRGLQHPIGSEIDIDRYMYRFDLRGAVPFVDQQTFSIEPNKIFFSQSSNTLMLFCLTNESKPFIRVESDTAYFEEPIDVDEIQENVISNQILPSFAFIPKYRNLGESVTNPWLPKVTCDFFNNVSDTANCVETIDVGLNSTIVPEPNMLIPINVNPFPYLTPNGSLPFGKEIYPKPKRLRMVMDGYPIENEEVILANRFQLSGNIYISAGDELQVKIYASDEFDGLSVLEIIGIDDLPLGGTLLAGEQNIPITDPPVSTNPPTFIIPRIPDYFGTAMYLRDPIKGENTKFTDELFQDDIIEIVNQRQRITGKFYTVGTEYIYYLGEELVDLYNNYGEDSEFRIQLNDIKYTLVKDSSNESLESPTEVEIANRKITYNGKYKIREKSHSQTSNPDTLFSPLNIQNVSFIPDPINPKRGMIEISGEVGDNLRDYFEMGEPFILSNVIVDEDDTPRNNVEFVFGGFWGNKLIRCFSLNQFDMSRPFTTTLTRSGKSSKFLLDYTYGTLDPYRLYYKVTNIISDSEIEIDPSYVDSMNYQGKINRIGFNIRSSSENPGLIAEGLENDGALQFQRRGVVTNSQTFFMPAARTNKVILYLANSTENQITSQAIADSVVTSTVTGVKPPSEALPPYQFTPFDYSDFNPPFGVPVYDTEYNSDDRYNHIDDEDKGILYFTDDEQEYITLETFNENNTPLAHGFAENDRLYIRKVDFIPEPNADPFGTLVDPADESELDIDDFEKCGLQMPVVEVINPYRFTIDKETFTEASNLSEFFQRYNTSETQYLTITNGLTLEFWEKYFDTVYMDGTLTANAAGEYISPVNDTPRSLNLMQKGNSASLYKPNYSSSAMTIEYHYGASPITISTSSSFIAITGGDTTPQGAFLFSINTEEGPYPTGDIIPADLLDVFQLRAVEFSVETE